MILPIVHDLICSTPDGLSIPFFSFGRKIHSRTLSLSQTLTSRGQDGTVPDWLLWARRSGTNTPHTTTLNEAEAAHITQTTPIGQRPDSELENGVLADSDTANMRKLWAGKGASDGNENEEGAKTIPASKVEMEERQAMDQETFVGPEFGEASMLADSKDLRQRAHMRPPPLDTEVRLQYHNSTSDLFFDTKCSMNMSTTMGSAHPESLIRIQRQRRTFISPLHNNTNSALL